MKKVITNAFGMSITEEKEYNKILSQIEIGINNSICKTTGIAYKQLRQNGEHKSKTAMDSFYSRILTSYLYLLAQQKTFFLFI